MELRCGEADSTKKAICTKLEKVDDAPGLVDDSYLNLLDVCWQQVCSPWPIATGMSLRAELPAFKRSRRDSMTRWEGA